MGEYCIGERKRNKIKNKEILLVTRVAIFGLNILFVWRPHPGIFPLLFGKINFVSKFSYYYYYFFFFFFFEIGTPR